MSRKLGIVFAIVLMNLLAGAMVLMGQDTPPPPPTGSAFTSAATFNRQAVVGQNAVVEGTLTTVFGDPRSPLDDPIFYATIHDSQGQPIVQMLNPSGEVLRYNLQRVRISGQIISAPSANLPANLSLQSIQAAGLGTQNATGLPVSGAQPFANVLCRFSNVFAQPKSQATIQGYFSNSYPNLDHYFRDMSYGTINLTGTTTTSFVTIGTTASYLAIGAIDPILDALAQDCATAAESQVNYNDKVGLNIMLNFDLFGFAFGGGANLLLDGNQRNIRVTWNPPWAQTYYVLGHEMGHAFGMPHSTGPSANPPSGVEVYVSAWDVMSDASGMLSYRFCQEFESIDPFGNPNCIAQGMIAAQLLYPEWMPVADQALVNRGTTQSVLLERLRPQPAGSDDLVALIPTLPNSSLDTFFYTVEVRENAGYDTNNMTQITGSTWTTLIHFVDNQRGGQDGQPLIVTKGNSTAINGPAAQWLPGDSFVDAARNVTINIIAREGNAVRVNIGNNTARPVNDAIASATVISTFPFNATPNILLATQATTDPTLSCLGNQRGYYTVWYRHTPTTSRTVLVNSTGSSYDTVLGVFSGAPGSLTPVACNDDETSQQAELGFFAQSGVTYYIALASPDSSVFGSAALNFVSTPPNPVVNRFSDSTPTLTWNAVTNAVSYELQIATTSAFSSVLYSINTTLDFDEVGTPLANGTYYWRVRAQFGDGTFSGWSAVDTFSIDVP